MKGLRTVWHLARADFLERVRRYSYLVTLGAAAWLGYGVSHGTIALRFDAYRGVLNSAWIGLQMALATAAFVSLAGFWVVRGSVDRDRRTRVGQILAATPLGRFPYVCGKLLSNFLVLGSMVGVLAAAALLMQLLAREAGPVAPWPLLSPFLLIALPAMAGTAAFALLFECVPFLAGGLGNVIWFFFWGVFGTAGAIAHVRLLDLIGFTIVQEDIVPFVRASFPAYKGGILLGAGPHGELAGTFFWPGMSWTAGMVRDRLAWFALALVIAAVASLFFDRFDTARGEARADEPGESEPEGASLAAAPGGAASLTPLGDRAPRGRFGALVVAELRLMLKGLRWWWWAVAAGLLVAQLAAPLAEARHHALAVAWIWPVLVWSSMGTREARFGTGPLVFSSPRSLPRQLPALWAAGVAVALLTGCGAGLRLLFAGDIRGALAWLAGSLFVPSLALALGCASGTGKLFEALYTALWYAGPMQGEPAKALDFFGSVPANAAAPVWTGAALVLFAVALSARALRMGAGAAILRAPGSSGRN